MATYRVTTPVAGFTGEVGSARFVDGEAVLDEEIDGPALAYCMNAGYGVQLAEEATEDETPKPARRTRSSKETTA
jgi:hypothetical protein